MGGNDATKEIALRAYIGWFPETGRWNHDVFMWHSAEEEGMAKERFKFLTVEEFEQLPQREKIVYMERAEKALETMKEARGLFTLADPKREPPAQE